jgi:ABC-type sugar transport system ATPase subunit
MTAPGGAAAVLEARGITKRFPGVLALDAVDFDLAPGEVHALIGENGAGKSTLIKILGGAYRPDDGEIRLGGARVDIVDPRHARLNGIAVVHQELTLFPVLTVAENLMAGGMPVQGPLHTVDRKRVRETTARALEQFELSVDPDTPVRLLSVAQQQVIEIARALLENARILVLDEPTSALSEHETALLFKAIRRLKESGISIIYISHRLHEVFAIADRATVLRDGRKVDTVRVSSVGMDDLIRMMVGRNLTDLFGSTSSSPGDEILRVEDLTLPGRFQHVSFTLRRGEILGFAGLIGAGRTDLARCLFGVELSAQGAMYFKGRKTRIDSPSHAMRRGIAYLSENRRLEGLFHGMSVRENVSVTHLKHFSRLGFMDTNAERAETEGYIARMRIQTPGMDQRIMNLSGGNQQKVIIARWLAIRPEVLIFDEPTRGIDVGAKAEIYALLRRLAADGMAIMLISSELPEVLGMSDRIAVMFEGRITGIVESRDATQEKVMTLAAGLPGLAEKER